MCTVSADELIVEQLPEGTIICGANHHSDRHSHGFIFGVWDDRPDENGNSAGYFRLRADLALGLLRFLRLNEERLREAVQDAD